MNRLRNSLLLAISVTIVSAYLIGNLIANSAKDTSKNCFVLQWKTVLPDLESSDGIENGKIFTIDGVNMVSQYEYGLNKTAYAASSKVFSTLIGVEEASPSAGILYSMHDVLTACNTESNMKELTGDSIITTIHSKAQTKAVNLLLSEFASDEDACISVVSADGAVLVDAGNNAYEPAEYLESGTEFRNMWLDYGSNAQKVGSSFKTIIGRILIRHNDELPQEYSVYNNSFDDVSKTQTRHGQIIQNHDAGSAAKYQSGENGVLHRPSSLAQAYINSSNTYFVRHSMQIGLQRMNTLLEQEFFLNRDIGTGTSILRGCNVSEERLEYLMFGQDAQISPIRLASMYNLSISGNAYIPFTVVQIRTPDAEVLYQANPSKLEEYSYEVSIQNDILAQALNQNFKAYLSNSMKNQYANSLNRLLSKSGTAELTEGKCNRSMAVTLLDKSGTQVICTGVITVNNTQSGSVGNEKLISCLLQVFDELNVM